MIAMAKNTKTKRLSKIYSPNRRNKMQLFSITLGSNRTQFSMWEFNGKYQARLGEMVICESVDYEMVRTELLFDLGSNAINYSLLLN